MLFKQSITARQRVTHMEVRTSVIAPEANFKTLTDSGSHFHHSGSSRVRTFIAINIMIITSAIAIPWHEDTLQHKFRSGYSYLDEKGPLLALTWMPASGPPEFHQKLFKQSCSRAH